MLSDKRLKCRAGRIGILNFKHKLFEFHINGNRKEVVLLIKLNMHSSNAQKLATCLYFI